MKLWIKNGPKKTNKKNDFDQIIFDGVSFRFRFSLLVASQHRKQSSLETGWTRKIGVTVTIWFIFVVSYKPNCPNECQHYYYKVYCCWFFNFRFIAVIALHFASSTFRFVLFSYYYYYYFSLFFLLFSLL